VTRNRNIANTLLKSKPYVDAKTLNDEITKQEKKQRDVVKNLYKNVEVQEGWTYEGEPTQNGDIKTITTEVTYIDKSGEVKTGTFTRSYNTKTGQLIMEQAFLSDLPEWVEGQKPELVPGRGTPTHAHVTLWQMKKMGIGFGEVKSVKMSTIQNIETVCHVDWLIRNYGEAKLNEFAYQTASVQYAETSINQFGEKITNASIDLKSKKVVLNKLREHQEINKLSNKEDNDAILKRYGLNGTEEVYINFDIFINVEPIKK
jgi:hypothetical protein